MQRFDIVGFTAVGKPFIYRLASGPPSVILRTWSTYVPAE
jgi:hypothetical protein